VFENRPMKIAILHDYQNVALRIADGPPPFVECVCVGLVSQFYKAHALATKEYAA